MINADRIGRRIRTLRKQKHISQERMALDLGLYQADISNLERATSNSSITDIMKLDLIAEYFGITLIDLLTEEPNASSSSSATVNVKLKEYKPEQYQIVSIACENRDSAYIAELTLKAPTGKTQYVSFIETDNGIRFYQSRMIMYSDLCENGDNRIYAERHINCCFLSGEDYIDIFAKADQRWVNICRYLIIVSTGDEKEIQPFIQATKGKRFSEIDVPKPDREPSELVDIDMSDVSSVYRYRLLIETFLKNPSVYCDIDNMEKQGKVTLKKLKASCPSEDAYKVWKKDLIDAKIEIITKTEEIVACDYFFAGMGQYKEIIPQSEVEGFKCWIQGNGSAFVGKVRPATKSEIRTYAARHIAEDLL